MEKFAKLFLGLNALVWIPYALSCIVYPDLLATLGVFSQENWVERTEVRAMYGGAQLAIGLFALLTLLNMQRHLHSALLFFLLLFSGLAFVRMAGLLIDGPGLAFAMENAASPAAYNSGALWFFELPMVVMSFILYRHYSSASSPK
jgi:hypothetical protein